jgi:cholesterol transport system auxiliary component
MFMRSYVLIVLTVLLTACSLFSPVKTECIKEYMVDVKPYGFRSSHTTFKTIAVSMPTANSIYQSKQMLYSVSPHELSEFAKNRWAEPPVQMFQPLMIQALQNTHHYKAVAPAVSVGRYDLLLNTQIIDFYQDFCESGSVFKLTLRVQIIRVSSGRVVAGKQFTVIQPAPRPNPYGGVIAANLASEKMLSELAAWAAKY